VPRNERGLSRIPAEFMGMFAAGSFLYREIDMSDIYGDPEASVITTEQAYLLATADAKAQRETASSLARLVNELRAQIKDILFRHAEDCEALTNEIADLKAANMDLELFKTRVEKFLGDRILLQQFYRVCESQEG
jgi:hypothetical protein